jgi:hypothetical protein
MNDQTKRTHRVTIVRTRGGVRRSDDLVVSIEDMTADEYDHWLDEQRAELDRVGRRRANRK